MEINTTTHYVKNAEFLELLILYSNEPNSREGKKAYEKIGAIVMSIAYKLAESGSFRQYTPDIKEEMIQDAIYAMIKAVPLFDHKKFSNPFSYFTGCSFNIFRQHLNKLKIKMERYVRLEGLEDNGMEYLIKDSKFASKLNTGKVITG